MKSDLVNNMEFHYYSATYHLLSHQYSVHSVLLTDLKLQKFCYIYDFQCNFMKILTINSDWFISIYVSYFDVEITWINKQFKQKDIKPNQINYFTKYQNISRNHWCLMFVCWEQDTCNNTHTFVNYCTVKVPPLFCRSSAGLNPHQVIVPKAFDILKINIPLK